jgi:hypothetical protein
MEGAHTIFTDAADQKKLEHFPDQPALAKIYAW